MSANASTSTRPKRKLTRQLDVLVLDEDEVTVLAQLRLVEVAHRYPQLRQPPQLLTVETCRVRQHATAVNDSHSLVAAQQDLVRAEIAVGATSLHLRDVRLLQAEVLVDAQHVLAHAERGHTVRVVRHTTQLRSGIACGERLPPRVRATSFRIKSCPVHQVGCAFVGTEEENLGLWVEVEDLLLDAGSLTGDEEIYGRVDVFLERAYMRGAERRKNGTLCTALGNILVLEVMCRGERVVLVEEGPLVDRIVPRKDTSVSI